MRTWFSSKVLRNTGTRADSMITIDKSLPRERDRIDALLGLACPAKIIFVLRDPYDQVEDEFRGKKRTRSQKQSFEASLATRLQKKVSFTQTVLDLSIERPDQVAIVNFESLVSDHPRSIQVLSDWLETDFDSSEYEHLNLAVSSENIAIAGELAKRNGLLFDDLIRTVSKAQAHVLF